MPKIVKFSKTNAAVLTARPGDLLEDGQEASGVIDDVRFRYTFEFDGDLDGARTKSLNCFISYKKHLASSYSQADDYKPTSASQGNLNTITGISLADFLRAFDDYGTYLGYELMGKQTEVANPAKIPAFSAKQGIAFATNVDRFGKHIHCYPTIPAHSLCPKTIDLSGRELQDFSNLMKFGAFGGLFLGDKSNSHEQKFKQANKLWDQYHNESWFHILVDAHDRKRLDDLLHRSNLQTRYKAMKDQEGAFKREEQEFLRSVGW